MSIQDDFYYKPNHSDDLYFFYDWRLCSGEKLNQTINGCFSIFYADGIFLESIHTVLSEYDSTGVEGCYWYYPDINSPYPEDVFDGVCFEIGFDDPNTKFYVTEQVSFDYARKACERFLEIHPEHSEFLTNILENWQPLNP